jgi:hypothetical protein
VSPRRSSLLLEDVESVPWTQLSHAYGAATDVPVWLRRLQKPRSALQALGDLYAAVLHQGSLYSATPLAAHFIARLAAETATPQRGTLIIFLCSFSASVEAGMARHADDLPETLSPAEFEAQCKVALREAGQTLLPGLEDAGADVRSATIYFIESLDPPLPQAVERLRQRLACEDDADVKALLLGALARVRALTPAECESVLATGTPWQRLRMAVGHMQASAGDSSIISPWAIQALVAHWGECAAQRDKARTHIGTLVYRHGAAMQPVVEGLLASNDPTAATDGVQGVLCWMRSSRAAVAPGQGMLLALVRRRFDAVTSSTPGAFDVLRKPLIRALIESQPATALRRSELIDALVALASADPEPCQDVKLPIPGGDSRKHGFTDVRVNAALTAFGARDPRWLGLLLGALAGHTRPSTCWAELGNSRMPLGHGLRQIGVPYTAELLAEIGAQFRAAQPLIGTPAWEEQELGSLMAGWMHLLEGWPPAEVLSRIGDEVCQILPKAAQDGTKLLARGEASGAVLASLRALTAGDGRTRLWALLALGRLTRDQNCFEQAEAMVEADNNTFLDDLLRAWASAPASAFFRLCRKQLTGKAAPSHPKRLTQCKAIRALATRPQVKPELETLLKAAWPTLLAIVDGGGEPLHVAATLAVELLVSVADPALRERLERELDECLIDVIEHGRNDWSGPDPHAKIAAAGARWRLYGAADPRAYAPDLTLAACMDVLQSGRGSEERFARAQTLLLNLCSDAAVAPSKRAPRIAACLPQLQAWLAEDRRVPSPSETDIIRNDLCQQVRLRTLIDTLKGLDQ